MRILAIESSCDDTAVAFLEMEGSAVRRLEHLVATQAIHAKYGGVVPEVAAREHADMLPHALEAIAQKVAGSASGKALREHVDAVAVTAGPGLITSLRVGVDAGRGLAAAWGVPIYGINHIEGHIYSNWLAEVGSPLSISERGAFPALALVVSGGHTELLLMTGHGKYRLLGATRDDAAGEAFDKTAKLLGLGYPGGPQIARLAAGGNPAAFAFPRPMIDDGGHEFSFSGLKTAVRYFVDQHREQIGEEAFLHDVAASVQQAIIDVLVAKTVHAASQCGVKTVLLAGGVAANARLRASLRESLAAHAPNVRFVEPQLAFCADNAAMIAMAAQFRSRRSKKGDNVAKLAARPDWELGRDKRQSGKE